MGNSFMRKINEVLAKADKKMLEAKISAALEMLKKGETDKLAQEISKIDKEKLMEKINEFDPSSLSQLNINKDEIKANITDTDLTALSKLLGDNGDKVVEKIKLFLK